MPTQPAPITLYSFAMSPYGMKVYWALIYKRLDFEIVYVQPRNFDEVVFSGKKIVPILKIGDQWREDSSAIMRWIDDLYPGSPLMGQDQLQNRAILAADQWVSERLVPLGFRAAIDGQGRGSETYRNGKILARIMRRTSGGIPRFAPYIWTRFLRKVAFVQREAHRLDFEVSLGEWRQKIAEELLQMLSKTGWIAASDHLTLADISAFSQFMSTKAAGIKGGIDPDAYPAIRQWLGWVQAQLPTRPMPELTPGWQLPQYNKASI